MTNSNLARCGCGGEAEGIPHFIKGKPDRFIVRCSECFVGTALHDDPEEAIAAWNKAMRRPVTEEMVERAAKVLADAYELPLNCTQDDESTIPFLYETTKAALKAALEEG